MCIIIPTRMVNEPPLRDYFGQETCFSSNQSFRSLDLKINFSGNKINKLLFIFKFKFCVL